MGSNLHFRVWIMFNVFDDNGSHERGQTFGLVVRAETQTNCNFEAHISHCRNSLDYNRCHYSIPHVTFSYSALVWSHYHLILPISLDYIMLRFSALFAVIRLKYKIMFNTSRANQMHRTWGNTERQCTVHCGCS